MAEPKPPTQPGTAGESKSREQLATGAAPPMGADSNTGPHTTTPGAKGSHSQHDNPDYPGKDYVGRPSAGPASGLLHKRPPEAGGDVTAASLAKVVRSFNESCRSRDFWGAMVQAGFLLTDAGQAATGRAASGQGFGPSVASRPLTGPTVEPRAADDIDEFTNAVRDFEFVRGEVVEFAPQVHNLEWHQSGGPKTGAAAPMGSPPAGPRWSPQNLLALMQIVAEAIAMLRKMF